MKITEEQEEKLRKYLRGTVARLYIGQCSDYGCFDCRLTWRLEAEAILKKVKEICLSTLT